MRALIIGGEQYVRAMEITDFAQREENWYRVGGARPIPGNLKEHWMWVPQDFRCVYSITELGGIAWRHLTISVPQTLSSKKRVYYPGVEQSFYIASVLFGFTGWSESESSKPGKDWMVSALPEDACVLIAQPFKVLETSTQT